MVRIEGDSPDKTGYFAIAVAAIFSAFGWFAVDRWIPTAGDGAPVIVAVMRTIFTLMPAVAGFVIANRRQRRTHRILSQRLEQLRSSLDEFQRVRGIEHELRTMDRLTRVAREAVKNTATSAKELFGAIEAVDDARVKERLVERYRNHTNNVVTVLSAVNEQMEESGRAIYRELSADEEIHILDRERSNTARGVEYAREIMQQRGIADGVEQLTFAFEQASKLQSELSSLKALSNTQALPHG